MISIGYIRNCASSSEHSLFGRGGWAREIQGRVIHFLPNQKGRINNGGGGGRGHFIFHILQVNVKE